jgi:uncharacterized protein (UPF0335 family)
MGRALSVVTPSVLPEQIDIAEYDEVEAERKISTEDEVHQAAQNRVKSIVERIERLEMEKREIAADIAEIYTEAKGEGFHVGALKQLVKERREESSVRRDRECQLDLYKSAIGFF